MRVAVLSPHRDDAAFSCGLTMHALLCSGCDVTVLNVFTRSDYAVDLATVDASLPVVDGVSAARLREDEAFVADAAALAGRGAGAVRLHDLHWLDAPLRLAVETEQVLQSPLDEAAVEAQAQQLAQALHVLASFDVVFVPLALGDHIDHRVAREAARRVVEPNRICWYEDLPYAARMASCDRDSGSLAVMRSNPDAKWSRFRLHLARAPHLKSRFCLHYPSQIAPGVAAEMAEYAALWSEAAVEGGAERWFATSACAQKLSGALQGGGAGVIEENVCT